MATQAKSNTTVVKCKCQHCGLHFIVYSWHKDWEPSGCPECGIRGQSFLVWRDSTDLQIFELVPGLTVLDSISKVQPSEEDGA